MEILGHGLNVVRFSRNLYWMLASEDCHWHFLRHAFIEVYLIIRCNVLAASVDGVMLCCVSTGWGFGYTCRLVMTQMWPCVVLRGCVAFGRVRSALLPCICLVLLGWCFLFSLVVFEDIHLFYTLIFILLCSCLWGCIPVILSYAPSRCSAVRGYLWSSVAVWWSCIYPEKSSGEIAVSSR